MRVRVSPAAPQPPKNIENLNNLAYVIGLAIGDGNLSNPNGRATKLRITCDIRYPKLMQRVIEALKQLLPDNKINTITRPKNCIDVYCHSNKLEGLLGWKVGKGPKHKQHVHIPDWIKSDKLLSIACLRGLIETDGSVYLDRGYKMVMFTTIIPELATNVSQIINDLDFTSHTYKIKQEKPQRNRYNVRVSKNTEQFIKAIGIIKN